MNKKESSPCAYFDCNATTPVADFALDAAVAVMKTHFGNPSSLHQAGIQAKSILESARKNAARIVGAASPTQIIFNSCATEGIHTAVFSALTFSKKNARHKTKVIVGATEHKAVSEAVQHWIAVMDLPYQVSVLAVDGKGQFNLEQLRTELPEAALVCTIAVNNETGVIQDLKAIEAIFLEQKSDALWLVDGVQALGKVDLNLKNSRINYSTFSGHKLYAPKGVGFLYVSEGSPYSPLIVGGGQESNLRSGTENLSGVAALNAVFQHMGSHASVFQPTEKLREFRDSIVHTLLTVFPQVQFNTPLESSVPTTLNFSIPGLSSKEMLDLFDAAGLRISSGSACSSATVKPSHVLQAMGLPDRLSTSALRLSFGPCTTEKEIELANQILRRCAAALANPAALTSGLVQIKDGYNSAWMLINAEEKHCIVIDPTEGSLKKIVTKVEQHQLKVLAIVDTHSHADHESVQPALKKKFGITYTDGLGWPVDQVDLLTKVNLQDGTVVSALNFAKTAKGNLVFAKLPTPGHTADSQSFLFGFAQENILSAKNVHYIFAGDTILHGGLGRTNFSISQPEALFSSLKKIEAVISPASTLICSAHDYHSSFATTLDAEYKINDLLKISDPAAFLAKKTQLDQELEILQKDFQEVVCGVTATACGAAEGLSVDTTWLQDCNQNTLLVDVREPHEYSFAVDWKKIGYTQAAQNIPLSHLVMLMNSLLTQAEFRQKEIILVCRSGNRSLQAVRSLHRLGLKNVKNLAGGIALAF